MLEHVEDSMQDILDEFGFIFSEWSSYIRDANTAPSLADKLREMRNELRPILQSYEDFLEKYREDREIMENL